MIDRDTRIGACADYLIGKKLEFIAAKWGVSTFVVVYWIRKAGFKLRYKRRENNHPGIVKRGHNER